MKNVSISVRLTFWFSAIFLLGFVAFGIAMWVDLAFSLSHGRDRTLARRAVRFADLLIASANQPEDRQDARFIEFADAMPEGNLIHLYDPNGTRLLPKVADPADFPWPPSSEFLREHYRETVYKNRHFRVFIDPVKIGARTLTILVAGQLEDNRGLLARFEAGLWGSIPALIILSALGGYWLSRRVLRPIARITTAVQSISIGNLSGRLPIGTTRDDLQRLAVTCNGMLSRLEDSVGRIQRFTADASHELRSPISFVRTVAEVALRNPEIDPESRDAFHEILAESVEASALLEDMLVLARADSQENQLRFESVDLADVLDEVRERAFALAEAKNQKLTVDHGGSARVNGDRPSLRRLLWTLVDNAVKYTPSGGRIELSLKTYGAEAHLVVRDSGIGIPEEKLQRVFERFFRADPSRTQEEGSGLGLAIAKWIADVHHAVIGVESTEGRGTTFRIVFPSLT